MWVWATLFLLDKNSLVVCFCLPVRCLIFLWLFVSVIPLRCVLLLCLFVPVLPDVCYFFGCLFASMVSVFLWLCLLVSMGSIISLAACLSACCLLFLWLFISKVPVISLGVCVCLPVWCLLFLWLCLFVSMVSVLSLAVGLLVRCMLFLWLFKLHGHIMVSCCCLCHRMASKDNLIFRQKFQYEIEYT